MFWFLARRLLDMQNVPGVQGATMPISPPEEPFERGSQVLSDDRHGKRAAQTHTPSRRRGSAALAATTPAIMNLGAGRWGLSRNS